MLYIATLELSESNEIAVKYGFILGLKELLLKSISQTNTKIRKQPKKRKKKSKPSLY